MTDSQIIKTARTILPLLDRLLGAKAPAAKKELRKLLAQAQKGGKTAPQKILALLNSYPAIRKWMREAETAQPSKGAKPSAIRPPGQRAKPPIPVSLPLGIAPAPRRRSGGNVD